MATSVTSAGLKAAADKVILAARPATEIIKLFTTDCSVDAAKKGSAVAVEVLSATAADFSASNGYTKSTNSIEPATVILNKHKKSTFQISDVNALTDELAAVWSQLAPVAGRAVSAALVADAIGCLTYAAAKSQITKAIASLGDFADVRAAAIDAGMDAADCTLILTPAKYAQLLTLLPANILGADAAIRRAEIGAFLGFKAIVESANASTLSAASTNKGWGYIVPTGALAVSSRCVVPVKDGGNLIEFGTIQDEATGFTFGQRVVVDPDQGNCNWTVDSLYGAALTYDASTCPNAPRFVQLIGE